MGDSLATRWPRRAGVVLAVCSTALLAQRVAIAGDRLTLGWQGRISSRLDLAAPTLIVLVAFGAARRAQAGRMVTQPLIRLIAAVYLAWTSAIVFAIAAVHARPPRGRLLLSLLFFRTGGDPLPGLSAGPLLLTGVLTLVLMGPLVTISRRPALGDRPWIVPATLFLIALAYRSVVAGRGHTDLFGPLSWLPNQLDLVGAGLAIALAADRLRVDAERLRLRVVALVVAAVSFIVAVFALGLPRSPRLDSAGDVHVFALVALIFAASSICAVVLGPPFVTGSAPRLGRALGVAGVGVYLVSEPAFTVVARQYHERVIEFDGGVFLEGHVLAPFIWSAIIAAAFGVIVVAIVGGLALVRRGDWRRVPRSAIALPAIVAVGLFVRVITLLGVAPERTDGGDPLFYHTTANVLARGRGFPEPLNWIAFQAHHPSAFHGPLYPVVLSISSRFGGTSYFDHKMMSILIGTALVLAVGVLARRIGGPLVGLAAGAFAALYPNLWLIDSLLYPEGLMALLVTLSMIVAYRWRDRPHRGTAALLGALIALAALARGEGVLLLPLLALPWMMLTRSIGRRARLGHLAVTVVACLAVLAPWMIRNATTFEKFVPLSTNGNEVMVYANCATAYNGQFVGYWDYQCQQKIREERGDPPGDESQTALYWRSIGINYARDHAGELPRVVTLRVLRQWELFRPLQNVRLGGIEGRNRDAGTMGLMMFYGLAALSLVGAASMRRRKVPVLPLGVQFLSVTITAAYTYGTIRFRAPAEPALCVLGAVGLVPVVARARSWLATGQRDTATVDGLPFVVGGAGGLRVRLHGAWQRGAIATWTAIGSVLALIALPLRGLYHTTGGTMEEAFMIVFPERMLKGDLPNRDFLHLYGPGALHVLMGWYKLVGISLESERTFGLLQHVAIIFAVFALARPWGRVAAAVTAGLAVFYVVTPIGLTAMAWNGGIALGLWSVVFALRARTVIRPRRCLIVAGVLAGLAIAYRPDLTPALLLVFAWFLWRNRAWRTVLPAAAVGL
ncbi:MAG TPA: glycosyltransferase family 39 protein, partial [Ilumatobacteraceae bacterium]|nr:glycosyltransferase family 39 protein [Ilumatobacteraceae bacterium]